MASDPGPAISVLQLRIALRGLSPPVWRRVLVPEHLTLGQLHHVIQVVMGWADEHLHTFSIRGRRYGEAREGVLQLSTVANELPLTAFHLREHEGFIYVYDFNAWWHHEIRMERRMLRHHPGRLPRCVAGCGPCPPEDIGGIERYLEARDEHNEYEFLDWIESLRGSAMRTPSRGSIVRVDLLLCHSLLQGESQRPQFSQRKTKVCRLRVTRWSLYCPELDSFDAPIVRMGL